MTTNKDHQPLNTPAEIALAFLEQEGDEAVLYRNDGRPAYFSKPKLQYSYVMPANWFDLTQLKNASYLPWTRKPLPKTVAPEDVTYGVLWDWLKEGELRHVHAVRLSDDRLFSITSGGCGWFSTAEERAVLNTFTNGVGMTLAFKDGRPDIVLPEVRGGRDRG